MSATQVRVDIVNLHIEEMTSMLETIVTQGIENGEFDVVDSNTAAQAVRAAMFIFDYPKLMGLYPLQVFEDKAKHVAHLLVHGLHKC